MAWVREVVARRIRVECGDKGRRQESERKNKKRRKKLTNHGQDPPADLEEFIGEDGSAVTVAERGQGPREGRELVLGRRRHPFVGTVVERE